MTEQDAAVIARGLSDAQRAAIIAFGKTDNAWADNFCSARELETSGACLNGLMDFDRKNRGIEPPITLVTRDYADYPNLHWRYSLTPLGLAVRAELEKANG